MRTISFTNHAEQKFAILLRRGVKISRSKVIETAADPEKIDRTSRFPLIIAQSKLDAGKVLRVVYKIEGGVKKIITFYPGRKSQYEKS